MAVSQVEHYPPQLPALGGVVHGYFFLCLLEVGCILDCISVRSWDLSLVPLGYSPSSGPVIPYLSFVIKFLHIFAVL